MKARPASGSFGFQGARVQATIDRLGSFGFQRLRSNWTSARVRSDARGCGSGPVRAAWVRSESRASGFGTSTGLGSFGFRRSRVRSHSSSARVRSDFRQLGFVWARLRRPRRSGGAGRTPTSAFRAQACVRAERAVAPTRLARARWKGTPAHGDCPVGSGVAGRVGEWGPNPLSVQRRAPTPLRPGNPALDMADSLLGGQERVGWCGRGAADGPAQATMLNRL